MTWASRAMRPDYVFAGHDAPKFPWMIVLAVEQDYDAMAEAPSMRTLVEVTRQYARGTRAAKGVANWLRAKGFEAFPYGGPMAGSFLLIPAAIEAGLGELGKHGSIIHPRFGANFRLACVLTDAPLIADVRSAFGADEFCLHCRVCSDACPPDAIHPQKTLVRGERRWYVDFDKCLPYFNEAMSCAICLAVCPFSRPEVGVNLVAKLAARRTRQRDPVADREPTTRRPALVMVWTQRGLTQLIRWFEAKPWISRIGSPRSNPFWRHVDIGDVDAVGGEGLEHRADMAGFFE